MRFVVEEMDLKHQTDIHVGDCIPWG